MEFHLFDVGYNRKFQAAFVWLQYHDVKCNKHFEKDKIKGPPEKKRLEESKGVC